MKLLVILVIFVFNFLVTNSVWQGFDLVRNTLDSWGSNWHTPYTKISPLHGNGPNLTIGDNFGCSIANIGDLNGDGIDDLAVGSKGEANYYFNTSSVASLQVQAGAVYILFMTPYGIVSSFVRIAGLTGGGPILYANDNFGYSVSSAGDLDGDGTTDLAVGAPGIGLAAVYILYLRPNGTVRHHVMIRGTFIGQIPPNITVTHVSHYQPNGPPIKYYGKFGSALAYLGDFDKDGIPDIATSALDASGGDCTVYLLYMFRNGTVKDYSMIGDRIGGGPKIGTTFPFFGSSIIAMGDLNGDGVTDIAVGAKEMDDIGTINFKGGVVFVFYLYKNGTVQHTSRISEFGIAHSDVGLPVKANDECGAALGFIGDINLDNRRQHRPELVDTHPSRKSIDDIVIGCPQRGLLGFDEIPAATDLVPSHKSSLQTAPALTPHSHLGSALAGYQDLDNNGLRELVVGAPGDRDGGTEAGALYIFFLRRRRFHPPVPDFLGYILKITLPLGCCCMSCFCGTVYFFWRFRRRVDIVETIVKQSNMDIAKKRERKKQDFTASEKDRADDYDS